MNYDVIADIHGQYQKLLALLQSLGYRKRQGAFRHPGGRQAIFLGDMIDAGTARCIVGNHEWNAIGYATPIGDGQYGQARSPKNLKHHHVFLDQVGLDSPRHKAWVEWFKTLPPLLDLGGIRVAHACWRQSQIDVIQSGMRDGRLTEQFLGESFQKKPAPTAARLAMDLVTKGLEIKLPNGVEMGTDSDKPVLVGHYWLSGRRGVRNGKVAVLDFSAAGDGPLVAYRWSGEPVLSDDKLIAVGGWS
jgi:hypothetical protein